MNTTTNHFRDTIKAYLDKRAREDELFAMNYAKLHKNIDDCITYILNTVQKSGFNGFEREEVFSMAVHYYDEDNIEVGKAINNCRVVVNHTVELTAEEKEEARQEAIKRVRDENYERLTKRPKKPQVKQTEANNQQSLF